MTKKKKRIVARGVGQASPLPTELALPFEFFVYGAPATLQSASDRKKRWKADVADAARSAKPAGTAPISWGKDVKAMIWYYYIGERPDCDVDNIVKPILDACKRIVYQDDRFVSEVCSHRVSLDSLLLGDGDSEALIAAWKTRSDFVHVRFEAAP